MKTKMESLEQLAEQHPPNAELLYVFGLELVERELWVRAVEVFDAVVEVKPKCYQSRYWAARCAMSGSLSLNGRFESIIVAQKLATKASDTIAQSEIETLIVQLVATIDSSIAKPQTAR